MDPNASERIPFAAIGISAAAVFPYFATYL
jgi:hypothetical protein